MLSWLHEAGIEANTQHARRIVVALDPCDRDGEFMSWEEFWAWWQETFSADAEPAEDDAANRDWEEFVAANEANQANPPPPPVDGPPLISPTSFRLARGTKRRRR